MIATTDFHAHGSQNVKGNRVSIIAVFEGICYYLGMITLESNQTNSISLQTLHGLNLALLFRRFFRVHVFVHCLLMALSGKAKD